jgi:hypothetical protein
MKAAAQQSVHLTLGILRQSQAVFYALAFFWLDGFAVPAPAQVTQTVSLLYINKSYIGKSKKRRKMNDLGFGILDRRTVIVSLLTIVIVNVFFQFALPIRISNAGEFFIDLVLFTGYLYLARSLLRLLIPIIFTLINTPIDRVRNFTWSQRISEMIEKKNVGKLKIAVYKIVHVLIYSIKSVLFVITIMPIVVLFNSSDVEAQIIKLESKRETTRRATIIRFVDRIGLIAIVIFATMPNYIATAKKVGAFGLIVMIFIYLLKGDFTFFIRDKITEKQNNVS